MSNMTIDDVMNAIKELRGDIQALDRKVDDFRSSFDHHASQESRIHTEIRQDIRSFRIDITSQIAGFNESVKVLDRDFTRLDARVELHDSSVH